MKPVDKLCADDFRQAPIWQFVDSEDQAPDETWVVATPLRSIPKNSYSLLVSAAYTLACDTKLAGYIIVTTATKPIDITPGALVEPRYCVLPQVSRHEARRKQYGWVKKDHDVLESVLGMTEAQIFPMRYVAQAPLGRSRTRLLGSLFE